MFVDFYVVVFVVVVEFDIPKQSNADRLFVEVPHTEHTVRLWLSMIELWYLSNRRHNSNEIWSIIGDFITVMIMCDPLWAIL